ncbi:HTH-type transcriptional regulator BetI [Pandoraea terrae]|uniref:HTH-type transcriptional regulator BetI n=1 Tax=Pandoraea terrae TaxID=1537710 RepID=A0A5E4Z0T6_9BURK|nr:HTH-type transcriptional regulator BetI [Pandoraea terrae]
MLPKTAPARQPKQQRSQVTRNRIAQAAIQLLGEIGEAGLTHRDVATCAQVSLAATTYHYASKFDLLAHASSVILEDYETRFRGFASRQTTLTSGRPTFEQFLVRLLHNAAGRERLRTIAWCEIMLIAGRNADTRALAKVWYARLHEIWTDIASLLGASADPLHVQAVIDRTIGLLFIVMSLGLTPDEAAACYTDGLDKVGPAPLSDAPVPTSARAPTKRVKGHETRQQLLDAAIRLMATHGAGAVTGRSIAAEAGVAPAVPSYYFKPVGTLIDAAREQLYEAAKTRYRESVTGIDLATATLDQIVDLTTAVLVREVTQFSDFNLATLAIEVEAARQPTLRPMVGQWFSDRSRPWHRLLTKFNSAASAADGLLMVSLFTGMQVRLLATGAEISALGDLRLEFLAALDALGYGKANSSAG